MRSFLVCGFCSSCASLSSAPLPVQGENFIFESGATQPVCGSCRIRRLAGRIRQSDDEGLTLTTSMSAFSMAGLGALSPTGAGREAGDDGIPGKGSALTRLSAFWFERTSKIAPLPSIRRFFRFVLITRPSTR